jgi:hypothetical protein
VISAVSAASAHPTTVPTHVVLKFNQPVIAHVCSRCGARRRVGARSAWQRCGAGHAKVTQASSPQMTSGNDRIASQVTRSDAHPVSGESRFPLMVASATSPPPRRGVKGTATCPPSGRRAHLRAVGPTIRAADPDSCSRSQELPGLLSSPRRGGAGPQTTPDESGFQSTPPLLLASLLVAPLAQLAEQLTLNQRVGGSIPSRRTISAGHRPAGGGPPPWRAATHTLLTLNI